VREQLPIPFDVGVDPLTVVARARRYSPAASGSRRETHPYHRRHPALGRADLQARGGGPGAIDRRESDGAGSPCLENGCDLCRHRDRVRRCTTDEDESQGCRRVPDSCGELVLHLPLRADSELEGAILLERGPCAPPFPTAGSHFDRMACRITFPPAPSLSRRSMAPGPPPTGL